MSEFKGTPGPWSWDSNPCDYDPEQEAPWLVDADGERVISGEVHVRTRYDRDLIAAAPELLFALSEAIEIIESLDGRDNSCDPKMDLRDLRAAIAKALGA